MISTLFLLPLHLSSALLLMFYWVKGKKSRETVRRWGGALASFLIIFFFGDHLAASEVHRVGLNV